MNPHDLLQPGRVVRSMLSYVAIGERTYGEHPWVPHTRFAWEFQAVLEGRCAPWLPGALTSWAATAP